ncbi:MAG: FAD binding domain-containing protein [Gemmataceae bacterium]
MKAIDYAAPSSIAEAISLFAVNGDRARALAGGTDVLVQVREGRRDVDWLIDLKHIPELNKLTFDPQKGLKIGAAVPCSSIYDSALAKPYAALIDATSLIGGIQIQNRASLGGNLCNASPAADTIPALIAHEAVCVIAGPDGSRETPVEKFCVGPGRTVLGRGEILVSLRLPAPRKNTGTFYVRFIPRNEMDIAVVGVGISVTLDESRTRCAAARVALGAVAPTPLLVAEAGDALVNGSITENHIHKAAGLAQAAAKPISDMRGDAEYRRHLVGVLTRRALATAFERAKH